MTDETDDEAGEVEFLVDAPESRTEAYEWTAPSGKGGIYLFASGVEQWSADNGVSLLHIDRQTGAITAQAHIGEPFHPIDKPAGQSPAKSTRIASIK